MIKLAPSILSADFANLKKEITLIDRSPAHYIHIDVMDGMFVPNISIGLPIITAIRKYTSKPFDVHLMIDEPYRYIEDFKRAGADIITVHAEACRHLHRTLLAIKNQGIKAAVALNPATPLTNIEYVLENVDMVLLMTVNPGFGGSTFIPTVLPKIKRLKEMINTSGVDVEIEVDGGITPDNVQKVIHSGADVIVAGSSVFKNDILQNIDYFYDKFKEACNE